MLKSLAKKFEADQDGENKHVFISDLYRDMLVNDVEKLNTSHDSDQMIYFCDVCECCAM